MASQGLSHAEVWDDSVLVDSWNEAFEEYKVSTSSRSPKSTVFIDMKQKYHSLAVKGEKVQWNSQQTIEGLANGDTPPGIKSDPGAPATTISEARIEDQIPATTQPVLASAAGPATVSIPQALLSTGKLSVSCIG